MDIHGFISQQTKKNTQQATTTKHETFSEVSNF